MSRNVHSRWQFPNSKLQFLKRSFKIATTETMTHSQISASKNSRIPKLQLSHCKIATPETMPHSKLFACVFKIETPKTMPYSKISACVFQIEVPALQNCNSRNKDLCKNNTNKNVLLSNGMNGGANYFTFVLKLHEDRPLWKDALIQKPKPNAMPLTRRAVFSGLSWGACPPRGISHKSMASSYRIALLFRSDGTAFVAKPACKPGK